MTENKSWCPLPWIYTAIRNHGDYRICCQANTSKTKGLIRDNKDKVYNANDANIEDVRNAELIKDVRKSMLNGEQHEMCVRCNREDSAGIISRRQFETRNWADRFAVDDAIKVTKDDGSIELDKSPVRYYDIRFGNLCNLKCRMCGPTDSSAWYKEHYDTKSDHFFDSKGKIFLNKSNNGAVTTTNNIYEWYNDAVFWKQIEDNIPNIEHIHTVGGEPFMIDQHYDLLQQIVDSGRSQDVIVEYNSNITNIPKRAWNIWKNFKCIKIGASIDGIDDVNDYIRYPSKWKAIEKNIDLLDNADGNFDLWFAVTIQIYNVFHIPELIEWKLKKDFKRFNSYHRQPFITHHVLHTPVHWNIRSLPKSAKMMVKEKYKQYYDGSFKEHLRTIDDTSKQKEQSEIMMDLLEGIINYMDAEDWSENMGEFMKQTKLMDDYRNQNYMDIMPELGYEIQRFLNKK